MGKNGKLIEMFLYRVEWWILADDENVFSKVIRAFKLSSNNLLLWLEIVRAGLTLNGFDLKILISSMTQEKNHKNERKKYEKKGRWV